MSDQRIEPPKLRTAGNGAASPEQPYGVDELAELVIDLLAATQLVPADKLALVRGRARQTGSLSAALVEEGVASSEGIARVLAARHALALVDLTAVGVDDEAAALVPLH